MLLVSWHQQYPFDTIHWIVLNTQKTSNLFKLENAPVVTNCKLQATNCDCQTIVDAHHFERFAAMFRLIWHGQLRRPWRELFSRLSTSGLVQQKFFTLLWVAPFNTHTLKQSVSIRNTHYHQKVWFEAGSWFNNLSLWNFGCTNSVLSTVREKTCKKVKHF